MPVKSWGLSAVTGMILLAVAGVIVGFDASNADISRPPSSEVPALALDPIVARTRFARDPLDRHAVYSLYQDATTDSNEAQRLLDLAAARSLRDGAIQSALIDRLIKSGGYAEAIYRLDGLMRARPGFRSGLSEALAQFVLNPESRQALIDVLADDPPWRSAFLSSLAGSKQDLAMVAGVFIGLRVTGTPPRMPELRPLLDRMASGGGATAAYSLWLSFLSEDQLARVGYVYDGEFEAERTETPFDWTIKPALNVKARMLVSTQTSRGRVLEISFANSQVAYGNVYQSLLIPPGKYVLAGDYKTIRLETERGLSWRLTCAGDPSQAIAQSPPMNGTSDWTSFEVRFAVPETGCESQTLKLELIAKAYLDRKASGTLWADGIEVRRDDQ
jgi:hypothetical protein